MDIRQLEAFVSVVEEKSFSRAADRLFLSQPTVSVHVRTLEEGMGTRLLDRLGGEVVPTPAGRKLYRYARKILVLKDQAFQDIQHFLGEFSGSFELAASTIPGEYLLPLVLAGFQHCHPKVKVVLHILDSERVIHEVRQGEYFLGVVGSKGDERGLTYIPLGEEELVVVFPTQNPLAQKGKVTLENLKEVPLIIREEGSGTRKAFEEGLKRRGMHLSQFKVVAELGSTTALKEGVKAGIGAAVISPQAVKDECHWGMMKAFRIEELDLERRFYLVTRSKRTLPPPAEELERFILSALAGES